jgi:hypothetical protein
MVHQVQDQVNDFLDGARDGVETPIYYCVSSTSGANFFPILQIASARLSSLIMCAPCAHGSPLPAIIRFNR